jgi:hypothetical protein
MTRLAETTPTPPQEILDEFNQMGRNYDTSIARPLEVNGLHKITVFRSLPADWAPARASAGTGTAVVAVSPADVIIEMMDNPMRAGASSVPKRRIVSEPPSPPKEETAQPARLQ